MLNLSHRVLEIPFDFAAKVMAWEVANRLCFITWRHLGKTATNTIQPGVSLSIETAAIRGKAFGWDALSGAAGPVGPVNRRSKGLNRSGV